MIESLTVVFIVLKLCGVIAWSWWVVFAPLLAYLVLIALFFAWYNGLVRRPVRR